MVTKNIQQKNNLVKTINDLCELLELKYSFKLNSTHHKIYIKSKDMTFIFMRELSSKLNEDGILDLLENFCNYLLSFFYIRTDQIKC